MFRWMAIRFAVVAASCLVSSEVLALEASTKCEAAKLGTSAKYAACRLKAESKGVKKALAPDYTRCSLDKFLSAEDKAGAGVCPSEGDLVSMQDFLDACTESVAVALEGGGLPLDVLTCNEDLATCGGNLATCTDSLGTCDDGLATCTGDLGTCTGDLGTSNASLTSCNTSLGTCNSNLSSTNSDLASCSQDLTVADTVIDAMLPLAGSFWQFHSIVSHLLGSPPPGVAVNDTFIFIVRTPPNSTGTVAPCDAAPPEVVGCATTTWTFPAVPYSVRYSSGHAETGTIDTITITEGGSWCDEFGCSPEADVIDFYSGPFTRVLWADDFDGSCGRTTSTVPGCPFRPRPISTPPPVPWTRLECSTGPCSSPMCPPGSATTTTT